MLDSRDRKVFIMTGARGLGGEGWAVSLERQEPNHAGLTGLGKKVTFPCIAMGSYQKALGREMM